MNTQFFRKTSIATLAVATLATGFTFVTINDADAGRRDFWAGVGAGVVTGVIVNEATRNRRREVYVEPRYSSWDAHVDWCYDRYRTYSHRDNRYTTNSGFRRRCNSPYD